MRRSLVTLSLLILLLPAPSAAETVTVRNIFVIDGDTFRCDIPGWPEIVGRNIPVRLAGINTPEKNDRSRLERISELMARRHLIGLLEFRTVTLRRLRRGHYFRLVAEVYADGRHINRAMVEDRMARPAFRRKRHVRR